MNNAAMFNIFFLSLTVQTSFNYHTMQGTGFVCSMFPLTIDGKFSTPGDKEVFFLRHSQMFSTNPYLFPAVVGSVVRIEENGASPHEVEYFKNAVMGPYAALGDSFFWGALRLFSSVCAVLLAVFGSSYAPYMLLLLFSPAQIAVRVGGYLNGLRLGQGGFSYIRSLALPVVSARLRYASLVALGLLSAALFSTFGVPGGLLTPVPGPIVAAGIFLIAMGTLKLGLSSVTILYGIAVLCMVLSI